MRYGDRAIESPAVISKKTPTPIGTAVEITNKFGIACRALRHIILIALLKSAILNALVAVEIIPYLKSVGIVVLLSSTLLKLRG